jgi:hypothetical protein
VITGTSAARPHGPREQRLEVVGEGLGDAARIEDAHRLRRLRAGQRIERGQRQAHRHAVVVVGVDRRGTPGCGGVTSMKSSPTVHRGAELAQLGGHRGDAVGLLHAPAADAGQVRGAVGKQRHHRQRHRGVGDVVAVQRQRAQRPAAALHLEPARAGLHLGAHRARGIDEADVALDGVAAHPFDAHRRAVAAIAPSATKYDADDASPSTWRLAGRAVAAAARDGEALPALAPTSMPKRASSRSVIST